MKPLHARALLVEVQSSMPAPWSALWEDETSGLRPLPPLHDMPNGGVSCCAGCPGGSQPRCCAYRGARVVESSSGLLRSAERGRRWFRGWLRFLFTTTKESE